MYAPTDRTSRAGGESKAMFMKHKLATVRWGDEMCRAIGPHSASRCRTTTSNPVGSSPAGQGDATSQTGRGRASIDPQPDVPSHHARTAHIFHEIISESSLWLALDHLRVCRTLPYVLLSCVAVVDGMIMLKFHLSGNRPIEISSKAQSPKLKSSPRRTRARQQAISRPIRSTAPSPTS